MFDFALRLLGLEFAYFGVWVFGVCYLLFLCGLMDLWVVGIT